MKVICLWCRKEGKPALVREKEPLDDPDETHGACAEHKEHLKTPEDVRAIRGDDAEARN